MACHKTQYSGGGRSSIAALGCSVTSICYSSDLPAMEVATLVRHIGNYGRLMVRFECSLIVWIAALALSTAMATIEGAGR